MQQSERERRELETKQSAMSVPAPASQYPFFSPTKKMSAPDMHVPFDVAWSVEITGVFTRGEPQSGEIYNVYECKLSLFDDKWRIYRRYSEFEMFHKRMKTLHPSLVLGAVFPPKKVVLAMALSLRHTAQWLPDKDFLQKRKGELEVVRRGLDTSLTRRRRT